jgi:hypothetical protein
MGSAGALGAAGPVGVAALGAPLAFVGAVLAALAAADDRPGAGGGPAGAAFAVQLDDDLGAQGGVLLVAADLGGQLLGRRSLADAAPGGHPARQGRATSDHALWRPTPDRR